MLQARGSDGRCLVSCCRPGRARPGRNPQRGGAGRVYRKPQGRESRSRATGRGGVCARRPTGSCRRHAAPGRDYVMIARTGTLTRPFALLLGDLETALQASGRLARAAGAGSWRNSVSVLLRGLIRALSASDLAAAAAALPLSADLLGLCRRGDRHPWRAQGHAFSPFAGCCAAIPGAAAAMTRCRRRTRRRAAVRQAHGRAATQSHHRRRAVAGDLVRVPVLLLQARG